MDVQIRILGEEYRNCNFTGKDICEARGIKLYFNKRDHSFSTTELKERIYGAKPTSVKAVP